MREDYLPLSYIYPKTFSPEWNAALKLNWLQSLIQEEATQDPLQCCRTCWDATLGLCNVDLADCSLQI